MIQTRNFISGGNGREYSHVRPALNWLKLMIKSWVCQGWSSEAGVGGLADASCLWMACALRGSVESPASPLASSITSAGEGMEMGLRMGFQLGPVSTCLVLVTQRGLMSWAGVRADPFHPQPSGAQGRRSLLAGLRRSKRDPPSGMQTARRC